MTGVEELVQFTYAATVSVHCVQSRPDTGFLRSALALAVQVNLNSELKQNGTS